MKDAFGHGSNGSGDGTMLEALRARLPNSALLRGGGIPSASSRAAVVAERPAAPVHQAMAPTTGGRDLVRGMRGTDMKHNWSANPIGDLKGKNH